MELLNICFDGRVETELVFFLYATSFSFQLVFYRLQLVILLSEKKQHTNWELATYVRRFNEQHTGEQID